MAVDRYIYKQIHTAPVSNLTMTPMFETNTFYK